MTAAAPESAAVTPGQAPAAQAAFDAFWASPALGGEPPAPLHRESLGVRLAWEAAAEAAIAAGGWDALSAEIESLAPGDGITVASTILAQVCRAVTARLTGNKPEGEVSVWIDDEGDGDAKVTVAWGAPRAKEKAVRGE